MKKQHVVSHPKRIFVILLMICITLISANIASATEERVEWYLGPGNNARTTVNNTYTAQSFTIGETGPNFEFAINLISFFSPETTTPRITFRIVDVNATNNQPINVNEPYSVGNLANTALSGDWNNVSMIFVKQLQPSTKYVIVMNSSTELVRWTHREISANYSGGTGSFSDDAGVSWTTWDRDQLFELWGVNGSLIVFNSPTPEDAAQVIPGLQTINVTNDWTGLGTDLINTSLYINGTLNETISLVGQQFNISLFIKNFSIGNWRYQIITCNNETTCLSSENRTLDVQNIGFSGETFEPSIAEGGFQTFAINVTVANELPISVANLIYDGTPHLATLNQISPTFYTVTLGLVTPSVTMDEVKSFFWQVILSDLSQQNSTSNNQTVLNTLVDDCSVGTITILNFSLFEEESQAILNGTIEIDLELRSSDNSTSLTNFSKKYENVTHAAVCLNAGSLNDTDFLIYTTTGYTAPDFAEEFHNIQRGLLSLLGVPLNISLFDLKDADSTTFTMTYKDINFLPIPGALFDIQRRYLSEGVFKSVEIVESDAEGKATGHFDVEGAIYRISITRQGSLIDTFDNVVVICDNALTGDCTITLNSFASGTNFENWDEFAGVSYDMTFNEGTRTITVDFNVVDGTTQTLNLTAVRFGGVGEPVCSNTLSSSAGIINCVIPESFGNLSVTATLLIGNVIVVQRVYTISPSVLDSFGVDAYVFAFILVMTFPLMMISSPIGIVFGLILGVLSAVMLLLIDSQGLIGPTSAFTWLIIAGLILIYKLFRRDN